MGYCPWVSTLLLISSLLSSWQVAEGDYDLLVRIDSYRNEGHRSASGCCDFSFFGLCKFNCDNYFLLCLRPAGFSELDTSCPSGQLATGEVGGDDLRFSSVVGDLTNPVQFQVTGQWTGSFQLRIDVHDSDIFVDDFVDEVFIEPQRFSPGGSFSTPTQYMGVGRRSQFELSFSVRCRENFYGEDCNTVCVDNEQYSCNTDGSRTCNEGFFNLPECLTQCVPAESFTCGPTGNRVCLENYFTESCSVFCRESADQVGGFYTCNPLTGEKECLRGYVDPATNCTMLAPTTSVTTEQQLIMEPESVDDFTAAIFSTKVSMSDNIFSAAILNSVTQNDTEFFKHDDSPTHSQSAIIILVLVTVVGLLALSLFALFVLTCRIYFRRKRNKVTNLSNRNITQNLLENGPSECASENTRNVDKSHVTTTDSTASTDPSTSLERSFRNPLYGDVIEESGLYSSVRSKVVHVKRV